MKYHNRFAYLCCLSCMLSILLLFAVALAGCTDTENTSESSQPQDPVYTKISAEQAKNMMDEENPFILLDVRTEAEYNEKHIGGAVLIPDTEIKSRAESELPDKDAIILVYCRSGRRSASAANELVSMGYSNVYNFGGILDWPYETVGE